MKELLEQYLEKFDDQFPLMLVRGMDEEEIITILKKCIEENKPYEIEFDEYANY